MKKRMNQIKIILILIVVSMLLSACSDFASKQTIPVDTSSKPAITVAPSATNPVSTNTEPPTATAMPPTPSEEPTPSVTPTDSNQLPATPDSFKVLFLNVGKGDSELIHLPGGKWVMIDTGPVEGFGEIARQLKINKISRLSAIFITHEHIDHTGGLINLLSMVKCDKLYTTSSTLTCKPVQVARNSGVPVKAIKTNQTVQIGNAVFTALGPVGKYADINDTSLVLMLEYKGTKVLFAADQLFQAESDLLKSGKSLKADVLKVAHHGEQDSSSAEFIKAVSPQFAVIPTSSYKLPHQQVLDNISAVGAESFILGNTGTMIFDVKSFSTPPAQDSAPDIEISDKDTSAQYITIQNNSYQDVDFTGWSLYSTKGNEIYFFPAGTQLKSGESMNVYCGKAAKTKKDGLIWSTNNILGNKFTDECMLYDQYGRDVYNE